jgi:hypothetical protein
MISKIFIKSFDALIGSCMGILKVVDDGITEDIEDINLDESTRLQLLAENLESIEKGLRLMKIHHRLPSGKVIDILAYESLYKGKRGKRLVIIEEKKDVVDEKSVHQLLGYYEELKEVMKNTVYTEYKGILIGKKCTYLGVLLDHKIPIVFIDSNNLLPEIMKKMCHEGLIRIKRRIEEMEEKIVL